MSIELIHVDSVGSTQREAARRFGALKRALAVCAVRQTGGRGRLGRAWSSPAGGLWLSVAWPLPGVLPGGLSLLVGAELHAALVGSVSADHCGRFALKWPNDVLLDGRKVAGILCESKLSEGVLLIGVGVNANFDACVLPSDVRFPATTLQAALGYEIDVSGLRGELLARLGALLAALERGDLMREGIAYAERVLAFRGEAVALRDMAGGRLASGVVRGLAEDGGLRIETESGIEVFRVGELSLRPN